MKTKRKTETPDLNRSLERLTKGLCADLDALRSDRLSSDDMKTRARAADKVLSAARKVTRALRRGEVAEHGQAEAAEAVREFEALRRKPKHGGRR